MCSMCPPCCCTTRVRRTRHSSMLRSVDYRTTLTVFQAIVMNKLSYDSPAWWGFASSEDQVRLEAFLRRSSKFGYRASSSVTFAGICADADTLLGSSATASTFYTSSFLLTTSTELQPSRPFPLLSTFSSSFCPRRQKTFSLECCIPISFINTKTVHSHALFYCLYLTAVCLLFY